MNNGFIRSEETGNDRVRKTVVSRSSSRMNARVDHVSNAFRDSGSASDVDSEPDLDANGESIID